MAKRGQIEHEGIVREVLPDSVKVGFIAQPGCVGCYAKGVCNLEQQEGEIIDVPFKEIKKFSIGEKVKIIITESLGLRAVFIAYFLPFLLLLVMLFVMVSVMDNELMAGIISLLILLPYYLLVYFYRGKIKKEINFTIVKILDNE